MENGELYKARHSCAHLVAAAVEKLYPEVKFGVGPVIEHGFYYDIEFPKPIGDEDLLKIEEVANKLIGEDLVFEKKEMSIDDAIIFFKEKGQEYKVELLRDLKTRGTTKMTEEEQQDVGSSVDSVTVYTSGDFVDLCRGPHIESTKEINPEGMKLTHLAGAYWRGDNNNPQLQRIYGLYFDTKKELEAHLALLEEQQKRDHRKIAKEQDLFFFDEAVGKGLVMWLPKGTILKAQIEKLAIKMEDEAGYVRVATPHLAKEELFLTSGHLPYYKDSMYPSMEMDDGTYYLRAMNCPHHHLIYNHGQHSYRDLPLRVAEYGTVYRNELSGTLAGLLRVRGMNMNDAHIYCTREQIKDEFRRVMELTMKYFEIFGLHDYWFRLSKWDPEKTEKYINEPENWEYAESVLREVLKEMEVPFIEQDDEAAFYGPKVDVQFKSVVGREETMSTIQLDFLAKERFGLSYTDSDGKDNKDVFVIHRAPLSTHERFMAFVIEHYAGAFPVWLAPVQVQFAPVSSEKHKARVEAYAAELEKQGIRTYVDGADETVGNKVRKAVAQKIPYILVMGDRELDSDTLAVRSRDKDGETISMSRKEFAQMILDQSAVVN